MLLKIEEILKKIIDKIIKNKIIIIIAGIISAIGVLFMVTISIFRSKKKEERKKEIIKNNDDTIKKIEEMNKENEQKAKISNNNLNNNIDELNNLKNEFTDKPKRASRKSTKKLD